MKRETLESFQRPFTGDLDYLEPLRQKAYAFIERLLFAGVLLDNININDWNCNYSPSVYICDRKVPFNSEYTKRYQRFSEFDSDNAVRLYFA